MGSAPYIGAIDVLISQISSLPHYSPSLSPTIQQATENRAAAWERGESLATLSKKKLRTHTKYKSIPAAVPYKFSCKLGLFMPSHLLHCTKHKHYRQRGGFYGSADDVSFYVVSGKQLRLCLGTIHKDMYL